MAIPAFDITKDLESLTNFKRNSNGVMKQIRKTGRPVALTVKGKAQAVLLDPAQYQQIMDRFRAIESIGRGLREAKKGEGMPVDDFFESLDKE